MVYSEWVKRRCLTCRALGPWTGPRCPPCTKVRNREYENAPARRALKAERYDSAYRRTRDAFAQSMADGQVYLCSRCQSPVVGQFHLDHTTTGSLWPSHPSCNTSARSNPQTKETYP